MPVSADYATKMSFLAAKWRAEQERQTEAQNKLDLYKDDYEDIIRDAMARLYCKENYERLSYHVNQSQNILKRIVNQISMVYKAPARRTLGEGIDTERWDEIVDDTNLDHKMKRINRYTNVLNETLVKVGVRRGRLVYDIITPNIVTVIQDEDDPTRAAGILYSVSFVNTQGNSDIWYYYWHEDGIYYKLDKEYRVLERIYEPDNYPYRNADGENVLPFVTAHRNEPDDAFFDQDTGRDLYNAAVLTGVKLTQLDYFFKTASFKQIYVIGSNVTIGDKQVMDPTTAIKAQVDPGTQASIGTLDVVANFQGLIDTLNYGINSIAQAYGISADAMSLTIGEMSGRALKIKSQQLLEIREDQLPMFRTFERELFDVTRIVNNVHASAYGWKEIPEAAEMKVDFGEIEFPEDPNFELDLETKKLKAGLVSLGAFYRKWNPDIANDEDAEKALLENLAKLKEARTANPTLDEMLDYVINASKETRSGVTGVGTASGGGGGFQGQDKGQMSDGAEDIETALAESGRSK